MIKILYSDFNGGIVPKYYKLINNSKKDITKKEYEENIMNFVQAGGYKWNTSAVDIESADPTGNHFDLSNCSITYINLNNNLIRKTQIESQIQKQGLNASRFDGIDASTINLDDYKDYLINNNEKLNMKQSKNMINYFKYQKSRLPQLGRYLSHIQILKEFLSSNKNHLLVLEDDAILSSNFKEDLIERMKYVPADWDLVLPGFNMVNANKNSKHNRDFKITNGVTKVKSFNGTFSLLYNKVSAKKWLDKLIPMDGFLDSNLSFIAINNPDMKVYGLVNPIVNMTGGSRIENNKFKYEYEMKYSDNIDPHTESEDYFDDTTDIDDEIDQDIDDVIDNTPDQSQQMSSVPENLETFKPKYQIDISNEPVTAIPPVAVTSSVPENLETFKPKYQIGGSNDPVATIPTIDVNLKTFKPKYAIDVSN